MPVQSEFEPAALTELIGHIYESAANPSHWNAFLAAIEARYPGTRLTLFGHDQDGLEPAMTYCRNYPEDDLKAYLDYYVHRSPYRGHDHKVATGKAEHCEVMVGDAEITASEIYNDYVRPRRLGRFGTCVIIERRQGCRTALSLAVHEDDAALRDRQRRLLGLLAPHLMRAFRMRRLIAPAAIAEPEGGAFDRWDQAALVLDATGRVVIMNRLAGELLQRSDGLSLGADARLCSIDAAAGGRLEAAIGRFAAMADAGDPQPGPDGVSLPRLSGGQAFRAVITPLPFLGSAGSGVHGPGAVLLVIVDPARVRRTPCAWIARQFGLTPAEQALTEAIVNGVTLAEAAGQLGIRLSTARNRLKIIQSKTQCRRQVDLVRLAFSLSVARQD